MAYRSNKSSVACCTISTVAYFAGNMGRRGPVRGETQRPIAGVGEIEKYTPSPLSSTYAGLS